MKKFPLNKRVVTLIILTQLIMVSLINSVLMATTGEVNHPGYPNQVAPTVNEEVDSAIEATNSYEDDFETGEAITKEPTKYPEDYDYMEAMRDSLIVSQFIKPFDSSMSMVLLDPVIQSGLSSMYTEETGLAVNLNYRDIYYYDSNNERQLARVEDLFSVKPNGEGTEFFIRYWVEELDEEGEPIIVEYDQRVYYTNPYSYFYLTLAISDNSTLVNQFKQSTGKTVQMDQYGNIVLNSTTMNNHTVIIPNFANPDLNTQKKLYLPSRMMMIKYDTGNLSSVYNWSEEANWPETVSISSFKGKVGDVLHTNAVTMYDMDGSSRVAISGITQGYSFLSAVKDLSSESNIVAASAIKSVSARTKEYRKYLGAKDGTYEEYSEEDMLMFVFGSSHTNYLFNKFQSDVIAYNELADIGTNGWGKTNSSFAYLPKSGLDFGASNLAFKPFRVNIHKAFEVTAGAWVPYLHGAVNKDPGIFNQNGKWGKGASLSEINLYNEMIKDFKGTIDMDKMRKIAYYSIGLDSRTDNPMESITSDSSEEEGLEYAEEAKHKTNGIIDIMHYMLNNIGSSMVAIQTSKMSITYKNIMHNLEENYLFHVSNILESETMGKMVALYMRIVIFMNLIWFIYWSLKLYSGLEGGLLEVLKRFLVVIILSTLPLITLVYFCMASEAYTEAVFSRTFTYWSLVDMDILNRKSDEDRQYVLNEMDFFRESGTISYENHGTVEMYGALGTVKDNDTTMENVKAIAMAKNVDASTRPETSELSVATLSNLTFKGVPSGSNNEAIMANKVMYDNSVFFYFYDTFRYHYYNYYKDILNSTPDHGFFSDKGMTRHLNSYREMITNPYFLYGQSFNIEDKETYEPQDVLGLSNLFSTSEVGGRPGYYEEVQYSPWMLLMKTNPSMTNSLKVTGGYADSTNPDNYSGGVILGYKDLSDLDRDYSDFERKLITINRNTITRLQDLNDYARYTDESLLFISAVIATMEFNQEMNKYLKPTTKLVPTTFNSQSYSLDTIFRSMFLESADQEQVYKGDLMWSVEEQGGVIIQALIIATAFMGQISGLLNMVAVMILFLTSCIVFLIAYNMTRDLFNEAWMGLLGLFGILIVIHMVFILMVYWICVPAQSVIQTSIFKGYSNGVRIILLLVFLTLRSLAVGVLLFFLAKNYKDLGGRIIMENVKDFMGNLTGKFSGAFNGSLNSLGKMKTNAGQTQFNANTVSMDTRVADVESDRNNFNQSDFASELAREGAEDVVKEDRLSEDKSTSENNIGRESIKEKSSDSKIKESSDSAIKENNNKDSSSSKEESNTKENKNKDSSSSKEESNAKENNNKEKSSSKEESNTKENNNKDSSSSKEDRNSETSKSSKDKSKDNSERVSSSEVKDNNTSSSKETNSSDEKEANTKEKSTSKENNERTKDNNISDKDTTNNNRSSEYETNNNNNSSSSSDTTVNESEKHKSKNNIDNGKGSKEENKDNDFANSNDPELSKIFQDLGNIMGNPEGKGNKSEDKGVFASEKKSDE